MKILLFIFPLIFIVIHGYITANPVFIVIHGTWALNSSWHLPGGDFFEELETNVKKIQGRVVSFCWSGKNNDKYRTQAAACLVKLIQSYPAETKIIIIGHSHGANVGMIASQMLANDVNNKHHIYIFYALGCPVHEVNYKPHMQAIYYLYNLFSFEDLVQPIFGYFEREYEFHERIANISVTINGCQPGHADLHHVLIARWLPYIHAQLQNIQQDKNCQKKIFGNPGILNFYDACPPKYEFDYCRTMLVERDVVINRALLNYYVRKKF